MGDNALELDVYLKLHMSELDEAAFKGIEKAAKRTASSIENVFANSLKKIQSKIATTFNANVFTNLTNAAKNAGAQIDNAITKPMSKAGKTVSTAFNFNKLTSGLSRLQKSISSAFNFTKLIVGIRVLQTAFDRVMKAVKAFASTTLSIQKGIVTAFGKISASVVKTASDISGLSLMLKSIPAAASAIGSTFSKLLPSFDFADLLKQSVMLSSSLTEVKNVVDIVFKDGAQEIYDFAQGAIENLGMTTLAAEQFAGKFGAALQTTGQSAKSTLQMSKALTQLTADLASFYDIEQDVAAEKLFSGVISGQVKPMRELGVDMSKASLEAYALSRGIQTAYKDMSAAEKQALRFEYAMDKLSMTSGDYARTINSTANQIRLLKNQFKELGSIVGSIINAFFNPLIHVLNRVVAALISVAKTIASIMGIDWTLGTGSGVAGVGGVADSYDELAESADGLADAEEGVADATDKAGKAAKKALAPFHKLNVLQNKDDSSKSGGKSGSGAGEGMFDIGDSIETAEAGTIDLKKAFGNLYDYLMGLDWRKIFSKAADAVNAFFEDLPRKIREFFEKINALWKKILDGINVFIAKLKTYNIGAAIAALFKGIGDLIYSALTIIDYKMLGKKFGELLNGIIDNAALFLRWGAVLGAAIQDAFEFLLEAVKEIEWSELGRDIYYALDGALDEIDPNTIYTAIVTTFNSVTEAILSFFTNLSQNKEDMDKIAKLIVTFINGVASFIGSEQFVELVSTIFDFLSTELGKVNEYFEQYNVQQKIVNGLSTLIEEAIRFVAGEDYSEFIGNIWGTVGGTLAKVYEDLKADGTIDKIVDGFKQTVSEAWTKAKEVILSIFDQNGDGDLWDEVGNALFNAIDFNDNGKISDEICRVIKDAWETAKQALTEFFSSEEIPLGLKLGGLAVIVLKVASAIAPLVQAISTLAGWISNLAGLIGGGEAAGGGLIGVFSNLAGVLGGGAEGGGLAAVFSSIGEAITGLVGGITAAGAAIAAAIVAIIAAFADLYTNTERFREKVNEVFGEIATVFEEQFAPIKEAFAGLKQSFEDAFANAQPLIEGVITILKGFWDQLQAIWTLLKTVLEPAFIALSSTISTVIQGIIQIVSGAIQTVVGLLTGFLNGDWTAFTNGISSIFQGLIDILTAAWQGWYDAFVYVLDNAKAMWETICTAAEQFAKGIIEAIIGSVKTLGETIVTAIETPLKNLENVWNIIKSTALGVIDAIIDKCVALKDKIVELIDKAKEFVSNLNPLKNFSLPSFSSSSRSSGVRGYANGGVFLPNKPQLAILGDNKSQTEYALTTGHLQQIADMMANTIGSLVTGSDQPITIPIYLGNELIDQRVITAGQMHNYRSNGR